MTAPVLQLRTEYGDAVATIVVSGELDLDGSAPLRAALADCFARRPRRLLLSLWDLRFCDCAGLNVLLEALVCAGGLGVEVRVEGVRAQVSRLFTLAGVEDMFTPDGQRLPPRIA